MEVERQRLVEIVVSIAAVCLFVLVLIGIGLRWNQGGVGTTGGLAIVVAIALFVLVMAAVGLALAYTQYAE